MLFNGLIYYSILTARSELHDTGIVKDNKAKALEDKVIQYHGFVFFKQRLISIYENKALGAWVSQLID